MLVKQRFYYRACDSTQDGGLLKDCNEPSACKERYKFQAVTILCKERTYFGMKKEFGELRESVYFHQLCDDFEQYHSTWPKEQ